MTLPSPSDPASETSTAIEAHSSFAHLLAEGSKLAERRHSDNTRKAYESDFAHFADWCVHMSETSGVPVDALPAEPATIWLYLTALVDHDNAGEYKVATLERRLSGIRWKHETNGYPTPTSHVRVKELMAGIRRSYGAPPVQADALTTTQLARMIDVLDVDTMSGLRDRALLLFGYAGAFRRAELASLTREQLDRSSDGYRVRLVHTKDDPDGAGRLVGIPAFAGSPLCPVAAVDGWIVAAKITGGPIMRRVTRWQTVGTKALTPGAVATILKRVASTAGIPPERISGHSLRRGHATTAAQNGAPDRSIMNQTGHERVETLNGYIRPATVFLDNSASYLGLDDGPP